MMKKITLTLLLGISLIMYSQVGINTADPKATLDIVASPQDLTKIDGIMIPRVKGSDLNNKDALYKPTTSSVAGQTSTIVYVTEAVASNNTFAKTAKVTSIGYYYFDGSLWQPLDINIYKDNGTLSSNRTVSQSDKTLAFTSTATTGTSHFTVDGTTFNVDAVNNRVGISTNAPTAKLDVVGDTATAPIRARNMSNSNVIPAGLGNVKKLAPVMIDDQGYLVRQFTIVDATSDTFFFDGILSKPTGELMTVIDNLGALSIVTFKFFTNYAFGNSNSSKIMAQLSFSTRRGFRLASDWVVSGNTSTTVSVDGEGTNVLTFNTSTARLIFEYDGANNKITARKEGNTVPPSINIVDGIKFR